MIIECATCVAKHTTACGDCIVTALADDGILDLGNDERAAIEAMSAAGLVSPLRLVSSDADERHSASG